MTHYIIVIRNRMTGRTMQTAETAGFEAMCAVVKEWDERYKHGITLTVRRAVDDLPRS